MKNILKYSVQKYMWSSEEIRGPVFPQCLFTLEKELNKSLSTLLLRTKKSYYLRYPLWRDKAGGLDHRQACSWEHVYQLDFHPCRNNFLGNNETETALSGYNFTHDGRRNKQIIWTILLLQQCLSVILIFDSHMFELAENIQFFLIRKVCGKQTLLCRAIC